VTGAASRPGYEPASGTASLQVLIPASELLQEAVRAEVRRQDLLRTTGTYLAELTAEVGEPSRQERARAEAIARRIASRRTPQAT
jgi:hypothetical protein